MPLAARLALDDRVHAQLPVRVVALPAQRRVRLGLVRVVEGRLGQVVEGAPVDPPGHHGDQGRLGRVAAALKVGDGRLGRGEVREARFGGRVVDHGQADVEREAGPRSGFAVEDAALEAVAPVGRVEAHPVVAAGRAGVAEAVDYDVVALAFLRGCQWWEFRFLVLVGCCGNGDEGGGGGDVNKRKRG